MTLATGVRAAAELLASFATSPALRMTIALAGLGQVAGTLLFVVNMWTRIRMPAIASPRSARGEP